MIFSYIYAVLVILLLIIGAQTLFSVGFTPFLNVLEKLVSYLRGFGISTFTDEKPETDTLKYQKKCYDYGVIPINGPRWCQEDHGTDFRYTGRIRGDCKLGFGKAVCEKYDPKDRQIGFWKNCIEFSKIPFVGVDTCKNDYGDSAVFMGRHRENCIWGQGKGYCEFNKSAASRVPQLAPEFLPQPIAKELPDNLPSAATSKEVYRGDTSNKEFRSAYSDKKMGNTLKDAKDIAIDEPVFEASLKTNV